MSIWKDLTIRSQRWNTVLIPNHFEYDAGASEAIFASIPEHKIVNIVSPILYMKARKNEAERVGMHRANVIDGAAMCETLSYIEQLVNEI